MAYSKREEVIQVGDVEVSLTFCISRKPENSYVLFDACEKSGKLDIEGTVHADHSMSLWFDDGGPHFEDEPAMFGWIREIGEIRRAIIGRMEHFREEAAEAKIGKQQV